MPSLIFVPNAIQMDQMASIFCLFFSFLFSCFYCYDLINFKIVFLSLYSNNLIMLEFRDVWEKDCCVCSRCFCSREKREKRGICVEVLSQHFSLHIFLPIWEDKKSGPGRENFLPCFLSLIFSFLPVFTPTKHTLSVLVGIEEF